MEKGRGGIPGRIVAIIVALLVVVAIVAYAAQGYRARGIAREANRTLNEEAVLAANDLSRSIALYGNDEISAENWGVLQEYSDELVRQESIEYIAIVDTSGKAVVHTNRSLLGERFQEPADTEDMVSGSAPVIRLNRRIATVYVGMNVRSL